MKKPILAVAAALAAACAPVRNASLADHETGVPTNNSYGDVLDEIADARSREGLFSGAIKLIEGDRDLLEQSYGWADKETETLMPVDLSFNILSVGKIFTAVSIAQLWEAGEISLDDPVTDYLPEAASLFAGLATIEQLLTHTSGVDELFAHEELYHDLTESRSSADIYSIALRLKPIEAPGGDYAYANTNFILLGEIVSRVSGLGYEDYVRRNVFEKAGMMNTSFQRMSSSSAKLYLPCTMEALTSENEKCEVNFVAGVAQFPYEPEYTLKDMAASAMGGATSTLDDMTKFVRAWTKGALIKQVTFKEFCSEKTPHRRPQRAYGYGCTIYKEDGIISVGHNGGAPGAQTVLAVFPDLDLALIIFSNHHGQGQPILDMFRQVLVETSLAAGDT